MLSTSIIRSHGTERYHPVPVHCHPTVQVVWLLIGLRSYSSNPLLPVWTFIILQASTPTTPVFPVAEHDIELFHTAAIVKVLENTSFGFGESGVNISFLNDLDRLNFRELPKGTSLGHIEPNHGLGLEVRDENGKDVTGLYFALEDGEIKLRTPVMPSMLTTNHQVIRQDCLCYLMERM